MNETHRDRSGELNRTAGSKWEQIVAILEAEIRSGVYRPGDQLPGVHDLMATWNISNGTAQKVHKGLKAKGLSETWVGEGTFVVEKLPPMED